MRTTFVLAPDSFKESMTAHEACQAMQRGIAQVFEDANFISIPMADGGEGTVDAILAARQGEKVQLEVMGPLPTQRVLADFALIDAGQTAVIEMAQANGIHLLELEQRHPQHTTTYGTGQLIKAALDRGVSKIIVGLGGSVTNDAGAGMAQALGVGFLDQHADPVAYGAAHLARIQQIDLSGLDPRLATTEVVIASDVNNPLTGPQGASQIFGPQKGASPAMVLQLDQQLSHFATLVQQQLHIDVKDVAGAGAAGGLGYGLMVFAQGRLVSGVEMVIEQTHLAEAIAQADYVFTGEGAIDAQTLLGKTPFGVAQVARGLNKPVIACAGRVGADIDALYAAGFSAIFGILDQSCDLELACQQGAQNLQRRCENIARLLKLNKTL